MTTIELLDLLKSSYSLSSDYKLAKFLGINQANISTWRKGSTLGDETAILVAEKLNLDPAQVLIWMTAERSKCPAAKTALQKAAQMIGHAATVVFAVFLLAQFSPAPADAGFFLHANNIHYANSDARPVATVKLKNVNSPPLLPIPSDNNNKTDFTMLAWFVLILGTIYCFCRNDKKLSWCRA